MNGGLPHNHWRFWEGYSVEKLYLLCKALTATHDEVIKMIAEPDAMSGAEERVYGYLIKFVGSLKSEDLQNFHRFVTGCSVMLPNDINVIFNVEQQGFNVLFPVSYTIVIPTMYVTPRFCQRVSFNIAK